MNIFRLWATILPTSLSVSRIIIFAIISIVIGLGNSAIAQVVTSITQTTGAGDLGTHVLPPIGHVYGITDGTSIGNNLYHSFAQFNVGTGDIAQFQTSTPDPNVGMHNILGRITDANPSTIFGTIDSATYYPNANLFLMNPYGFLFGPNAMVNVGGMVAFTTADYLRLTNDVRFEVIPGAQDTLLSAFPVAAFGFLGSNPAAIAVQGSQLTVANGTSLSLVGGNHGFDYANPPDTGDTASVPDGVTMTGGRLSAPGGQINLASVASAGELLIGTLEPAPNINGTVFTTMGNISLSQGAMLNVSGDAAGTVRIQGGQFVIADATILADTGNADGASTAIDIHVTGDLSITDTRGISAMTARTTGTGDAGAIQVTAGNLTATSNFIDPSSLPTAVIDSHTSGDGRSGDVHITTGNLAVSGTTRNSFSFIDSGTAANGRGGDVMVTAEKVDFKSASISTGQLSASATVIDTLSVNGSAGNLTVTADTLQFNNSNLDTTALLGLSDFQKGGDITLQGRNISLTNTQVTSSGIESGGSIKITAERVVTDFATMETDTIFEQGGSITIETHDLALTNGSSLISTTFGDGNAGNILVSAADHIKIIGDAGTNPLAAFRPSGIFSNSFGDFGSSGSAGNVMVTTPSLEMIGGRINTVTASSGQGGNVTLNIAESLSISGEFPSSRLIIPSVFDIGPLAPSGIVTSTVGSEFCAGPCGNAGDVSINTGSISMSDGSQINSGTSSTGNGGLITINANDTISMSGRISDGSPVGIFSRSVGTSPDTGSGGNIALAAGQSVTISDGAAISASSTGPGNTGNIQITAGNQFAMTDSSVTTEANQASGGSIKITTDPSGTVQLTNSTISASVLDGKGGGGSVNIDPQYVILLNSQILAQAVQGPGGNISITTNFLLSDANSVISASSQFGVNGPITVQSPNAPISGHIQPLGATPLIATSLFNQRCASLAGGEFSSFTVAGRDSLPTEPGGWLASPLATLNAGMGLGVKAEGGKAEGERLEGMSASAGQVASGQWRVGETPILSLRQIAPAGFLTQTFAVDEPSGCQSS
jgi:filamentous hemagglutinin family protein